MKAPICDKQPSWLWRLVRLRPRWPRGKYNGRRITGADLKLTWRTDFIDIKPELRCRHGQFMFLWLGFRVTTEATYHFHDA
jgi:hypothetical protein